MTYLEYFELSQEPFSNAPVSRFYYNSAQHSQALTRLLHMASYMKGLSVLIDRDGRYFIDNNEVLNPGLDSLKEAITRFAGDDRERPVTLRADAMTPHQAVVTAMDALGELGFTRLSIATTRVQAAGAQ